jgi:ankyrin repeat protein
VSDEIVEGSGLNSALWKAAGAGDVTRVRELIEAGADVNHVDRGWSVLMVAVEMSQLEVALALISAGADVNFCAAEGWSVLHHAVDVECDGYAQSQVSPDLAMVDLLLRSGANPRATHRGVTPGEDATKRLWAEGAAVLLAAEAAQP